MLLPIFSTLIDNNHPLQIYASISYTDIYLHDFSFSYLEKPLSLSL